MAREFTRDDVMAIRETVRAAQKHFLGCPNGSILAMEATQRYHNLNGAQLYAICHSYTMIKLTDPEIATKLHLLTDGMTVGQVWQVYSLPPDPNFNK